MPTCTQQKTILCVDDDPQALRSLERILQKLDHDVQTVSNPEAGLYYALHHKVDLILLDLRMPKLDGYGFLNQIRCSDNANVPVLIYSGNDEMLRGYQAGCSAFILKNSKPDDIRNLVSYFLDELEVNELNEIYEQ